MKLTCMGLVSFFLHFATGSNIQFTFKKVEPVDQQQYFSNDVNNNSQSKIAKTNIPVVINTWPFLNATRKAWEVLSNQGTALDAVEQGCSVCEEEQCDGTVGYGGSPDENGETTLDAMIMDGPTHKSGAVAGLRRVKQAISVARKVMENTDHTLLVGEWATEFALQMGFKEETLETADSLSIWKEWKEKACQPNFWRNVKPNPRTTCGPYSPLLPQFNTEKEKDEVSKEKSTAVHDTIGMVVIDSNNRFASGTSTNGARHKIPGRVGDAPITGSGSYVDQEVGGAAATGDGDILMRFLPSLSTVEYMRNGMTPSTAAAYSLKRISMYYPNFEGAIVAVNSNGEFGAACHGFSKFSYSVANSDLQTPQIFPLECSR